MNKSNIVKKVAKSLKEDLCSVCKAVKEEVVSDFVFVLSVLYGCFTASITVVYLLYYSGIYTAWKPWAIMIAPYWTIGNLILAFISWIGYRTYQAIKNQK